MAEKIVYTIEVDEKGAVQSLQKIDDGVQDVNKSAEASKKGLGAMSGGFKALGTAIKGAGIGLLVAALGFLVDAFSKNQVVMDAVSVALGTIQDVFTQISNVLVDVYTSVSQSSDSFDALGKVVKGIITIALTPMKIAFFGIKLGIQEAQLIWENSMFGDGDPKTVKALNLAIQETKDSLVEVGSEAIQAGKDIGNNIVEAVTEVGAIANQVIDGVSKIDIAESAASQRKINNLKNQSILASALNSKLIEEYDRQAEKLRQIRDDETLSIAERTLANENLAKVLEEQSKIMVANSEIAIALAREELSRNNTIENRAALIEAEAEKAGILAQVEGLRSEQLANQNALMAEQRANTEELALIGLTESERKKQEIEDEAIRLTELAEKTITDKLELNAKLKEIDEQEKELKAEVELEEEILRQEAEIAKQEFEFSLLDEGVEKEKAILEAKYKQELEHAKKLGLDTTKLTKKYENDKVKIVKTAEQEKQAAALASANSALSAASQLLDGLSAFAEEGSKDAQNIAIAQVVINTISGGIAAVTKGIEQFGPIIGGILGGVTAAGLVVSANKSIKEIKSTKPKSSSAPKPVIAPSVPSIPTTGGEGVVTDTPPPEFSTRGDSDTNQLAGIIEGQNDRPIKAFVVGSDVTTQQELDRNTVESTTF